MVDEKRDAKGQEFLDLLGRMDEGELFPLLNAPYIWGNPTSAPTIEPKFLPVYNTAHAALFASTLDGSRSNSSSIKPCGTR
jgi:hypothetical protein